MDIFSLDDLNMKNSRYRIDAKANFVMIKKLFFSRKIQLY